MRYIGFQLALEKLGIFKILAESLGILVESVEMQGSHSHWKNDRSFSSQGKVREF